MMLEELERRNYSAGTTRRYLRFVERFAQHFGKSPDQLGPDDLRSYQAYLFRSEELERRNYSAGTTRRYLRFVERFAQHFGKSPDQLGPDDLRSYQAYLL